MKRLLLLLLLCGWLTGTALADGARSTTAPVEASMLVTGTIVVAPDGSVSSYAVDHPEKLPSGVLEIIGNTLPRWKFKPVLHDGQAVMAKATMSLRIVARELTGKNFAVSVQSASFGTEAPGESITFISRLQPKYPHDAVANRVAGTVYLLLKVGRQGRVIDAAAEQVNLRVIGPPELMKRWRDDLAKASLSTARKWTFKLPTSGAQVDYPYWYVRIPINFTLSPGGHPWNEEYGHWMGYVPGPREVIPWLDQTHLALGSADAVPDGGIEPLGSGLQLTSGLKGS